MNKYIFLLFAVAFFACKKDEADLPQPSDISNIQAEPRVGGALVKWTLPADSNFLYLELSYEKKGARVVQKVSKYTDSVLVSGLLNKLEYNFDVQPFNADGKEVVAGTKLTSGMVRPVRRPIDTKYYPEQLTKLAVTDAMIETYTQEVSEGPKMNLVDNNPNTFWHSAWSNGVAPLPHWVKISFAEPTAMGAIRYFFRNNASQNGRPTQFALETSDDGITWNRVWTSAAGLSVATPVTEEKKLPFDKNYTSRYFRVMVLATQGNTTYVTLGDMSFYTMKEELTDMEQLAEANY